MAQVFTPGIKPPLWGLKPTFVSPKWRWAWKDWLAVYPFQLPGTAFDVSKVGGSFDAAPTSGLTWSNSPKGFTVHIPATDNERLEDGNAGNMGGLANGTELVIHLYGRVQTAPPVTSNARRTIISLHKNSSGGGVFALFTQGDGSEADLKIDVPFVAEIMTASGVTYPINEDQLWTISRRGDDWRIWRDGVELGSATNSAAFNTTNAHTLRIGAWSFSAGFDTPLDVKWYYAVVGKRGWSLAQHRALAADPFGPFRMARRPVGRVPVAVGGFFTRRYYDELLAGAA